MMQQMWRGFSAGAKRTEHALRKQRREQRSRSAEGKRRSAEEFQKTMFQVSVEESFSAGHALRGYKGKCENPHGHNYRVRVTLEGTSLDSVGLLFDFVHLKQVIHGVIQAVDHKFLNDVAPFDVINPSA